MLTISEIVCIRSELEVQQLLQIMVSRTGCFKEHVRWVIENAKDGYIKDNLNIRLSVSLA